MNTGAIFNCLNGVSNKHLGLSFIGYYVEGYSPKSDIRFMTLVDLVEMLSDWLAASKRHKDGDVFRSIEINQERFGYPNDFKEILKNTAKYLLKIGV